MSLKLGESKYLTYAKFFIFVQGCPSTGDTTVLRCLQRILRRGEVRLVAFCKEDEKETMLAAGADFAGLAEIAEKIQCAQDSGCIKLVCIHTISASERETETP